MKISYLTHDAVDVHNGEVTVLGTNNQTTYLDIINSMNDYQENLIICNDNYDKLSVNDAIDWVGDVMSNKVHFTAYINQFIKKFVKGLTEDEINQLHAVNDKIYRTVQEQLFMADLPLKVTFSNDLINIFKYAKIHIDGSNFSNPYDIIRILIKLHLECNDKKVLGLTNVAHYLNPKQIQDLVNLCNNTGVAVFIVEFMSLNQRHLFEKCNFHYIDEDFIDWHY
ncbi:type II-A CRISPR-associated protein Csn2 [Apilactobacillus xinyiensis]|uniref:type II-A CRISPR-associated protein Csn2 n=1 Tax=Apilactobacillus xinyiensis TaxID=2841032 RepID=UPI001C7CF15D|nr:type II-A CRISPR-associated protein Csn2 [Apilactobacillus xinyiensis]